MDTAVISLSRYILPVFMAFFAFNAFLCAGLKEGERGGAEVMQNIFMVLIHVTGFFVLFLEQTDQSLLVMCACQELLFFSVIFVFRYVYPESSPVIINDMCVLMSVGFVILTRISPDKAFRQFLIVTVSCVIGCIVPFFFERFKAIRRYSMYFGIAGILLLLLVYAAGAVTNGSRITFTLAGITFQPSEFVKLLFVFFAAGELDMSEPEVEPDSPDLLRRLPKWGRILAASAVAGAHILILVLSRDLGAALIFFVIYCMMLYAAIRTPLVLLCSAVLGALASLVGYRLFSHVRTRVLAWADPFSDIDSQGYQITQSLFAIGTGSWFGMGLGKGSPGKIPIVTADFIFSAISEEFGTIFSICLLLVCVGLFLMFMNAAMHNTDPFYRLLALGFAVSYGFQLVLSVGGVTRFIPLTGVTLPFLSYGGSSVTVSVIMVAVIEGIYSVRNREHGGQPDQSFYYERSKK
ncbi:MAG: FtsW/RodA/SpoVE family cell cycle protein [Lachnospiraceae bacterium]|nr:FtsW/RodA/SpoVE family cell cycle protein [Lachnospiraceae bacterium]